MCKVCILSDLHDWHSRQIKFQLNHLGYQVSLWSFEKFFIKIKSGGNFKLRNNKSIFDGIWVRFISSGSLEEITFKLSVLHMLKNSNIHIHNSAEVIEKTVDKFRTSALLASKKIRIPKTWVYNNKSEFNALCSILLEKKKILIAKPLFGSQGKGIKLIYKKKHAKSYIASGGVYYFQEFIDNLDGSEYKDLRVLVSNHKIISVIERSSANFITNYAQGGIVKKIKPNSEIRKISIKISKLFDLNYGGIDLKIFKKKIFVLEINSIPSWKGVQTVEKKNIARILVHDFVKKLSYV